MFNEGSLTDWGLNVYEHYIYKMIFIFFDDASSPSLYTEFF